MWNKSRKFGVISGFVVSKNLGKVLIAPPILSGSQMSCRYDVIIKSMVQGSD